LSSYVITGEQQWYQSHVNFVLNISFKTALVNLSIENNCFPDKLKEAQVTPIFKKSDQLMKTN
jgi:hypothetical protein